MIWITVFGFFFSILHIVFWLYLDLETLKKITNYTFNFVLYCFVLNMSRIGEYKSRLNFGSILNIMS